MRASDYNFTLLFHRVKQITCPRKKGLTGERGANAMFFLSLHDFVGTDQAAAQ
jgi:hypothetical protein